MDHIWQGEAGEMGRQGDVFIMCLGQTPPLDYGAEIARDNGFTVLAYGEHTGHTHAFPPGAEAVLFGFSDAEYEAAIQRQTATFRHGGGKNERLPARMLLHAINTVRLEHQEHEAHVLPPAWYEIRRQVEITPQGRTMVAD